VVVDVEYGRGVRVRGDADKAIYRGHLCPKGGAFPQASSPGRAAAAAPAVSSTSLHGCSTDRLIDVDESHDPYSGQARMSNMLVAIRLAGEAH